MLRQMLRCVAVVATGLFLSSQSMAAGILRYATIGEPPSLDMQMGTATIAGTIGEHMFETLYAFDSKYKPQPLLATGEKVEDGGKKLDHLASAGREVPQRPGDDRRRTSSPRSSAGASSARAASC